jgi:uncharacterized protein YjbI with pentapeptide repeats
VLLCAWSGDATRKSFKGATMYWAMLAGADLSGCNFEGADLRGAVVAPSG